MDTTQKNRGQAERKAPQGASRPPQRRPQSAQPAAPEKAQRSPAERQQRAQTSGQRRPSGAPEQGSAGRESRERQPRTEVREQNRPPRQEPKEQKRPRQEAPEQKRPPREVAPEQKRPSRETAPERKRPEQQPGGNARKLQSRPASGKQAQKNRKQKQSRRRPDPADGIGGKRRAYGNSKPKEKSGIVRMGESIQGIIKSARAKSKAKRKESPSARRKRRAQQPAPAVIYTSPQAFNRDRLLVQLITVTAVVVALVMGLSVFFKVEVITVSGTEVYTPWAVREASGIAEGDSLLTFSRSRAGAQIKANLPYVKDVSFGIKLPDTVNIIVVEEEVVYSIQDTNGQWWLITSQGRVVEQTNSGKASNYTKVLGVALESPGLQQTAVAAEEAPTATDESGAPILATVTGEQRLSAALEILQALEANDIVGDAASVDVSQIENIVLWYGTRYQVTLGDSSNLEYKISCMNDVIMQLSDYQSGMLDVSFRIWTDQVGYTPFS